MDQLWFYRGGNTLICRDVDIRTDKTTGLVRASHGLSVYDRADHPNVLSHGGAFLVGAIPDRLRVIQRSKTDPSHHEITPVEPMTRAEYQSLLDRITLSKVT